MATPEARAQFTGQQGSSARTPHIHTPDRRVRIFISSTISELAPERRAAEEAVHELRQTPVLFETSARPHPPRAVYSELLEQSDVFVGIYWESYGSVAPGMSISGIEDEYELSHRKPKLIYVKEPVSGVDLGLCSLLGRIRESDEVSYKKFKDADELRDLLASDLALVLAERFRTDGVGAPSSIRYQLPSALTPLIGRDSQLKSLTTLFQQESVRLVTLTGTGGVGKTRLALEVGRCLASEYGNGAAFVDLAPLQDFALVPSTILQTLNVGIDADQESVDLLRNYLIDKEILLILDNFEHLLAAAPTITSLLAGSPGLKVIATSRAALRVEGEREVSVEPFELPKLISEASLDDLARNEAIAFFVQRAQSIRPEFELNSENSNAVAGIVTQMEGLPLAISLAAAQIRTLPNPAELLRLLMQGRLRLVGGLRDAPDRQRTMESAIAWSYDLLSPKDQTLFRHLGVFSGGSLEAIEYVTLAKDSRFGAVLTSLESLVEASLVKVRLDSIGRPRYSMLESIREFAGQKLDQSNERERVERAFTDYFADLSYNLSEKYGGIPNPTWMHEVEDDIDNLRTALTFAEMRDDPYALIRLVWNLWRFWNVRGFLAEGRQWLDQAFSRADQAEDFIRADLASGAAQLARRQRDYSRTEELLTLALDLHRELGESKMEVQDLLQLASLNYDQANEVQALSYGRQAESAAQACGFELGKVLADALQGAILTDRQEYERAQKILVPVIVSLRDLGPDGDEAALSSSLSHLGRVAFAQQRLDEAISLTNECLELKRELGDTRGIQSALLSLARMVQADGDATQAEDIRRQSLKLSEEASDPLYVASSKMEMGLLDASRSAKERETLLRQALPTFIDLNQMRGVVECVEGLAAMKVDSAPENAVTLYAAADALRTKINFGPSNVAITERREPHLVRLRENLSECAFSKLWDDGWSRPLRRILEQVFA